MLFDEKYDAGFEYGWKDERFKTSRQVIEYISKLNMEDSFNRGLVNALMQRFGISPESLRLNLKEMKENPPTQAEKDMYDAFELRHKKDFVDPDLAPKETEPEFETNPSEKIGQILDKWKKGELTEDQAKAMISEFSSTAKSPFRFLSGGFIGRLGLAD